MATTLIINDAHHWRQQAKEASRVADLLEDPLAKHAMWDIARSYEQLAVLAEVKTPFKIAG